MKKVTALFIALILTLSLCACSVAQLEASSAEVSQGPAWQEQYDLGVRYLSEGNYEEAIIAFTSAIGIDPKQAPAYVGRGDAYTGKAQMLAGNDEETNTVSDAYWSAVVDYLAAIELDETDTEIYLKTAGIYEMLGEINAAMGLLSRGFNITGDMRLQEELDRLRFEGTNGIEPTRKLMDNEFWIGSELSFDDIPGWVNYPFNRLHEYLPVTNLSDQFDDYREESLIYGSPITVRKCDYEYNPQDSIYNDITACAPLDSDDIIGLAFYSDAGVPTSFKNICTGDSLAIVAEKLGIKNELADKEFTDLSIYLFLDGQNFGAISNDDAPEDKQRRDIFIFWEDSYGDMRRHRMQLSFSDGEILDFITYENEQLVRSLE